MGQRTLGESEMSQKSSPELDKALDFILHKMGKDKMKDPQFKVTTCCHGTPALEFRDASPELHALLRSILLNRRMDTEDYRVTSAAGAFLQGGSDNTEGWILIEFWVPDGAQAFVDYVARKWAERND